MPPLIYCGPVQGKLKGVSGFWEGIWLTIRPIVYILFIVNMVIGLFNFVPLVCMCVCVCVWCLVYLKAWYRI